MLVSAVKSISTALEIVIRTSARFIKETPIRNHELPLLKELVLLN